MKKIIIILLSLLILSNCASIKRSKCWCPNNKNPHTVKVISILTALAITGGLIYYEATNNN